MTEKEKMRLGHPYDAIGDEELRAERSAAKSLCREYSMLEFRDDVAARGILKRLLGAVGKNCEILAPFFCDYGYNIEIGDGVFMNHNCVILDPARVIMGNGVLVGPNCGFYTASHPLDVAERRAGWETAHPIRLGNDVWIGGNSVVLPGVDIGEGAVIGAGSVVTRSIPAGVVAVGNPCRVLRNIKG